MHRPPPPPPRKTLPITGTALGMEFKLDHEAALSVAYARKWLKQASGLDLDVMASGVARRALAVYVTHLGTLATIEQQRVEFRATKQCCSARAVDEDERVEAQERLRSFGEGLPLPPFPEVLHGAAGLAQRAAMVARVNADTDDLMNELASTRWGRMKGIKPTPKETT